MAPWLRLSGLRPTMGAGGSPPSAPGRYHPRLRMSAGTHRAWSARQRTGRGERLNDQAPFKWIPQR